MKFLTLELSYIQIIMKKQSSHHIISYHTFVKSSTKLILLFLISFAGTRAYAQTSEIFTTIIVMRHAEKADEPNNPDPELSEEGKARAEKIAELFMEDSINAVYATSYKRTMHTVKPLADTQNLSIKEYHPADEQAFAEILSRHQGQKIVICGHSNTIPLLLKYFTEKEYPILQEDEYDKIFIITKSTSGKSVT